MRRSMLMVMLSASLLPGLAMANADLAKSKNCLGCHAVNNKVLGPSFKDVATKYAGQKGAEDQLVQKVLKGSTGTWGAIAMPANNVTEQEAHTLVKWILATK
ncbi:c-type cytochrome [Janthinobacterium sp. 17J80-10]|uniref:c-type cytochrome n=1 Tax=Janthinobacterium sp. 17J80-10 TaxID=2497863 RepID=UPI0010055FFA|nr:c-type cytochrome [Janthinobacterium sp. 17J80-10]QAU34501.1 c-type cytochrome [Janthinobacterium sp. 17J80-10]